MSTWIFKINQVCQEETVRPEIINGGMHHVEVLVTEVAIRRGEGHDEGGWKQGNGAIKLVTRTNESKWQLFE